MEQIVHKTKLNGLLLVFGKLWSKDLASIRSNFGWLLVSEAIGKGMVFLTQMFLARRLGVDNFGLLSFAQSLTLYFWLAVDLGTNMYGIKEISRNRDNPEGIVTSLLSLRIASGLFIFTLFVTITSLLAIDHLKKLALLASAVYLITYSFNIDWVFKGLEKFSLMAFASIITSIAYLGSVLLFVNDRTDIIAASLAWSAPCVFGNFILLHYLRRRLHINFHFAFDIKSWIIHLKESCFFSLSGALVVLYQYFPILLLNTFYSDHEIGIFSGPYKIVFALCTIGYMLPMAFYPAISMQYQDKGKMLKSTIETLHFVMLACGLPTALICFCYSDLLIKRVLGVEYFPSIKIFRIIVWLVPLYFLKYSYGIPLGATGKQKYHTQSSAISLCAMVLVGIPLTLRFGLTGCCISLLIAESLMVLMLKQQSKVLTGLETHA